MKNRNLSDSDIEDIREAFKNPYRGQVNEMAHKYGVTRWVISNIKEGRTHLRKVSSKKAENDVRIAYEKGYRVSTNGIVTSPSGKELLLGNVQGYGSVGCMHEGVKVTVPSHRLAAFCFYGEELFEAECVRHLDGDKRNLSKGNIALGTYSDNSNDRSDLSEFSRRHRFTRLSREQVLEVRELAEQGMNGYVIAKKLGIDKSTSYRIINGKSYRDI